MRQATLQDKATGGCRIFSKEGRELPLLGVKFSGCLQGRAVELEVLQRFRNTGATPLEAVYLFPLPESAAVCGLELRTGDQVFRGEVEEREQAFEVYDEALAEGYGALLLDQERPNVYQMSVGNILPGQEVVAAVRLVLQAEQEGPALRVTIPSTVAPRYLPESLTDTQRREFERSAPPYSLSVPYGMTVDLDIDSASAIRGVESPSHPIRCAVDGTRAQVTLSHGEVAMDRDFVLTVEVAEPHAAKALVGRFDDRDHLLLELVPEDADHRVEKPRNVCFLVDCSGSMMGESIDQARRAVDLCLRALQAGDRFQVVCFGSSHEFLFRAPRNFHQKSLDEAAARISGMDADLGGTEIVSPLQAVAEQYADDPVDLVLLTDGQVGNEEAVLAFARQHRGHLRIFSFGIGMGSSEFLVRGLARASGGAAEFVHPGERIEEKVLRQFGRIDAPLLSEVRIDWGADGMEQAPVDLPPLFPGDSLLLPARAPEGVELPEGHTVRLTALSSQGEVHFAAPVHRPPLGGAIPLFWARARIRDLEAGFGLPPGSRQARGRGAETPKLVALSKQYGLICSETSFVAVQERTDDTKAKGPAKLHKIPLAVPAGWHGFGHTAQCLDLDAAPRALFSRRKVVCACEDRSVMNSSASFGGPFADADLRVERQEDRPWFLGLLGEQRADGSFNLSDLLREVSGIEADGLKALLVALGPGDDTEGLVATTLALLLLERNATDQAAVWGAAAGKARAWLKTRTGTDLVDLRKKLEDMLGA